MMAFDTERFAVTLLHSMSDAVVYSDAKGRIRYWNTGAERMFGHSASEVLGQLLDIIIPEALRGRHWSGYEKTMRTGAARYGAGDLLAVPAVRKDGSRISIEFTIAPFHDKFGQMLGIAAIMRDVTKRFEEMTALRKRASEQSGPAPPG
jgi:PAS domain S-box-containing protein